MNCNDIVEKFQSLLTSEEFIDRYSNVIVHILLDESSTMQEFFELFKSLFKYKHVLNISFTDEGICLLNEKCMVYEYSMMDLEMVLLCQTIINRYKEFFLIINYGAVERFRYLNFLNGEKITNLIKENVMKKISQLFPPIIYRKIYSTYMTCEAN